MDSGRNACTCQQEGSLAAFVRALGDGSRCFSCGGVMRAPAQVGPSARGMARDVAALCEECGSEVGIISEPIAEEAGEAFQPPSSAVYSPAPGTTHRPFAAAA